MKSDAGTKEAFFLGHFHFILKGSDQSLINRLTRLFPKRACANESIVELDLDDPDSIGDKPRHFYSKEAGFEFVRVVIQRGLDHHLGSLWFDAAALVNPQGVVVLITGASFAGKSTSAMALALGYDWKIINEDIALFDTKQDQLVTFSSPLSVRKGTVQRVREATSATPSAIYDGEWMPLGDLAAKHHHDAHVHLAINLSVVDPNKETPLRVNSLSPGEYVRQVLPISNALRMDDGVAKLTQYISKASCYRFTGGSLAERLEKMNELAREIARTSVEQGRPAVAAPTSGKTDENS